ncbi:5'-methylthioadenosine/adenosylhomocysteine nucleosidase [soil metagenome]
MYIGIMGALPEETNAIKAMMQLHKQEIVGNNIYYIGELNNHKVVLTNCGCGKSLAAATVTVLIVKYAVKEIIFTGVAGAVKPELKVGDIVIGKNMLYHDMDPRPIFPKFRVPFTDNTFFTANHAKVSYAQHAALRFTSNINKYISSPVLASFGITIPKVTTGTIATGDKFITNAAEASQLTTEIAALNEILHCVEMEGAAVAHICENFSVDYSIIRTISDNADHSASVDFGKFIKSIAAIYSAGIVSEMLRIYSDFV